VLYIIAAAALLIPLYLRLRGKGAVLQQMAADED
jgi:putative tricarboxylic transport membrane protein